MRVAKRWGALHSWAVIIFTTTLFTALGLEGYLRLTLPSRVQAEPGTSAGSWTDGQRLGPGRYKIQRQLSSGKDVPLRINSLGFRGPEVPANKEPHEIRILVLGDSITFGNELPEEEIFATLLGGRLGGACSPSVPRVMNAGQNNAGTQEELNLLAERGLPLLPDVVVLSLYLNDSRPPWGFGTSQKEKSWLRRNSVLCDTLATHLSLQRWRRREGRGVLDWVKAAKELPWKTDRAAFLQLAHLAEHDWGAGWTPEAWEALDSHFGRLQRLSEERRFRVLVALFPVAFQAKADFLEDTPQRELAARARSKGFPVVDLLPILRDHAKEDLFFDQCHLRARGHALVADALAESLCPLISSSGEPESPAPPGSGGRG